MVHGGTASETPCRYCTVEGLTDCYREVGIRGGVIMPSFVELLSASFASTPEGGVEDVLAMLKQDATWNLYWEDKAADLESITTPAYIAASYTNPIHTNGSIEGYMRLGTQEKWLRIHNTGEWDDYYHEGHTEDLRRFFDHYLKGMDNGWETTPRVRMSVLNPGGKDIVDRPEEDYPLARTQYRKLYLHGTDHTMSEMPKKCESIDTYDSDDKKGKSLFAIA